MAGLRVAYWFERVPLVANAWRSVLVVIPPSDQMVQLLRLRFGGSGVAGDAQQIEVRLTRVTGGTGDVLEPVKLNNGFSFTPRSTYWHRIADGSGISAEPTEDGTAPYFLADLFHPQGGVIDNLQFDEVFAAPTKKVALQLKVPLGQTAINVSGVLYGEE